MRTIRNCLATGPRPAVRQGLGSLSRALGALLLCVCAAAQAQIIQNGSFEAPAITDGSLQASVPTGWTGGAVLMNPLDNGAIPGNAFIWPQAADGQQFEDIGNTAAFALSQAIEIVDPGTYEFHWMDNVGGVPAPPGFDTAPYAVTLTDAGAKQVFSAAFDSYHADGQWQSRTIQQALGAGSYTLTFTSLNQPNHTDTLIDAVSVGAAPPVPEPGSALMLLAGWAALQSCRRERHRR
jgi:hypothetical protein